MERFGQMLQIDASPFDWLSKGSMISLHGAIDDGTGNVTALRFEPTECLDGYFRVLEETVLAYGVPRSIDSDAHSIFFSPKPDRLTLVEELRGARDGLTQFGKALDILGISPIKALSPQAKGRIERLWGTLQHRLVVDLRVADEITAFMPAPSRQDLALVLCRRAFRKMTGDSTLSWKNRKWAAVDEQDRKALFRRGTEVEVLTLSDGQMALRHGGLCYRLVESEEDKARNDVNEGSGVKDKTGKPPVPALDHPWRRGCGKRPNPREELLSVTTVTKEG